MKKIVYSFSFSFIGIGFALTSFSSFSDANQTLNQHSDSSPYQTPSVLAALLAPSRDSFSLHSYESSYLLYTYTNDMNKAAIRAYEWSKEARRDEVKFQISLGLPIWRNIFGPNTLLAASYTQRSFWQALNSRQSAPFRETNYEPQLFVGWTPNYPFYGWTLTDVEVGLNHQSNGQGESTSRSWNRVYSRLGFAHDKWYVQIKPWFRIPEGARSDDNSDILHYLGYYQLKIGYQFGKSYLTAKGGYNWSSGYGGVTLGWSYPIVDNLRFYTQLFSGYGESLIDYNHKQTRIGVGLLINDLL